MGIIKKVIITQFLFLAVTFSFLSKTYSQISVQEQINNFNTTVTVLDNGKIHVNEEIIYNFGYEQRHGIYRDIPYSKTNQDNKKYLMTIDNIKVLDEFGKKHNFAVTNDNSSKIISIKIGDADKYVTGIVTYVISYDVSGAISYFSDHDEIFWNFSGNEWQVPINSSLNTVMLPNSIPSEGINYICFTGIYGSKDSNCLVNKQNNIVTFISTQVLSPGEGITGTLGFPKGYVEILEPKEDKSWIIGLIIGLVLSIASILWHIVYPIKLFLKRWGNKKYLEKTQRIVAAWFEPPNGKKGDLFTPAETGLLIDKTPDHKEVTATIIHLAQKGFFKIISSEKDFIFKKLKEYKDLDSLDEHEKLVLDALFSEKDEISTKDIKKSVSFGKSLSKFYSSLEKNLENEDIFVGNLNNAKGISALIAVLAFMTFNIPLLLVLFITRKYYIRFSENGVQKYSETASLYNFLISQDEQLDFQAKNQMFFEKLLPYATAFGVEKIWSNRFKDLQFTQNDWYEGDINNFYKSYAISSAINSAVRSSYSSYTSSTRSSSGFSSGFSGGGHSGGGGGGGGGGSW